jgi:hypothetical protein
VGHAGVGMGLHFLIGSQYKSHWEKWYLGKILKGGEGMRYTHIFEKNSKCKGPEVLSEAGTFKGQQKHYCY